MDDRYDYAREKLWQAIETLVGDGSVQDRLKSAAEFLLRLMPDKQASVLLQPFSFRDGIGI
jgi:hypothetical protein